MAAPLDLLWRQICMVRSPWLSHCRTKTSSNSSKKLSDFSALIRKRYIQAKRSVVVRTQNPETTLKAIQKYDHLNSAFFTSSDQGYILAEYESENGVKRLLNNSSFFSTTTQFPLQSRCVCHVDSEYRHYPRSRGGMFKINHFPDRLCDQVPALGSLEAELVHLHKQRSLTDLDLRMRFMVCLILEDSLKTISQEVRVVPFGSCLNGFGWWNSDLDMMSCFHKDPFQVTPISGNEESSMKYLTEVYRSERQLTHHSLSLVAALLELMPRTTRIHKILHARVPIIRFKHILMDLDCDVSLQAVDSIRMTELLYLLSEYDARLKLLMTGIKEWAVVHNQTSSGERQKPTTLGLLLLLIFFLQTRSPPVLPTLRQVQSYGGSSNAFVIEGVRYRLPNSHKQIPSSMNSDSVESLLHGFFKYFSTFDFETNGISISDGCAFPKTVEFSPLLIENPLCIGMNVCKNVSLGQLQNLQAAMADAALALEKRQEKGTIPSSWLSSLLCERLADDVVDIKIESILSDFNDDGDIVPSVQDVIKDTVSNNVCIK